MGFGLSNRESNVLPLEEAYHALHVADTCVQLRERYGYHASTALAARIARLRENLGTVTAGIGNEVIAA